MSDIVPTAPETVAVATVDLAETAAAIRKHYAAIQRANKRTLTEARAAGLLLLRVKAQLPHGDFKPWIRDKLGGMSYRSAAVYMAVAGNWPLVKDAESINHALRLIKGEPEPDDDADPFALPAPVIERAALPAPEQPAQDRQPVDQGGAILERLGVQPDEAEAEEEGDDEAEGDEAEGAADQGEAAQPKGKVKTMYGTVSVGLKPAYAKANLPDLYRFKAALAAAKKFGTLKAIELPGGAGWLMVKETANCPVIETEAGLIVALPSGDGSLSDLLDAAMETVEAEQPAGV